MSSTSSSLSSDVELEDPIVKDRQPDSCFSWTVVLGSFLMHFVALGNMYSFGVYVEPLQEAFDRGQAEVAFVGSVVPFLMLAFSPFSGKLADRFSLWKVSSVVDCYLLTSFFVVLEHCQRHFEPSLTPIS